MAKPASFETTYLMTFDFDGNVGDTFEPSPNGVGVEENYEDTLRQIFGETILGTYHAQGGLRNRAPAEVIGELHDEHPEVLDLAKQHCDEHKDELATVMPRTANLLDSWDEDPLKAATEVYIRQDLINSLEHIGLLNDEGLPWPRPCRGFESFWRTIQLLNESETGFDVNTAIISSGYDEYIAKVFDVWGLPYPDIWVTDDKTRGRKYPSDMTARVKPAPFGMALAHHEWLQMHGMRGEAFDMATVVDSKNRMFYFGDGLEKDGQLAARSRIGFGHFDSSRDRLENMGSYVAFGDWQHIEKRIINNTPRLAGGVALTPIIYPNEA